MRSFKYVGESPPSHIPSGTTAVPCQRKTSCYKCHTIPEFHPKWACIKMKTKLTNNFQWKNKKNSILKVLTNIVKHIYIYIIYPCTFSNNCLPTRSPLAAAKQLTCIKELAGILLLQGLCPRGSTSGRNCWTERLLTVGRCVWLDGGYCMQ